MILSIRNILVYLINIILGVVAFFLGFRILFELFSANPSTPFVSWIYNVSSNLMTPFSGIFPNIRLGGGAAFDIVALVSLVAYTILAQLLITVVDAVTRPVIEGGETVTHTHRV